MLRRSAVVIHAIDHVLVATDRHGHLVAVGVAIPGCPVFFQHAGQPDPEYA